MRPNTYNPDCDFDPDQRDLDASIEERNKDDAREAARLGFALPGEEPLDKVAFDCGYKAGAASVDRRAIVSELKRKVTMITALLTGGAYRRQPTPIRSYRID